MIAKALQDVTIGDLQALIEGRVAERKQLEFKREIPSGGDANREFLKDVSSLANTDGGDLIVGIEETNGMPVSVAGIPRTDADRLKQRLSSLLANGLDPRLPAFEMELVNVDAERCVLIVRVGQSWLRPHMVQPKDHGRFYARNPAGKHPMDAMEIRNALLSAAEGLRRLEAWHDERISDIARRRGQPRLVEGAFGHICVIPLASFHAAVDVPPPKWRRQQDRLIPPGGGALTRRIVVDGFVSSAGADGRATEEFSRAWRTGQVEAATTRWCGESEARRFVRSIQISQECTRWLTLALRALQDLAIPLPYIVRATLISVEGARPYVGPHWNMLNEPKLFDRDRLILPDVWIDHAEASVDTVVGAIMDSLWNAAGLDRAPAS